MTNAALGWDDAIDKLFLNDDGTPLTVRTDQSLSRLHGVISSPSRRASKKTRERLPKMPARPFYRDDPEGYFDPSLHAAVRRVRLNLAVALIERGQLVRAAGILDALRLPNGFSVHGGSQVSWIAEGYLALIDHLGGNLVVAEHRYAQTIAKAQTKGMLRLAAIFLRHHADLKRRRHQHPQAKRLIDEAVSISLKSAQRDVYHYCRISQAILALDMDGPREARCQDMVNEAYAYGQTMGIPRLERGAAASGGDPAAAGRAHAGRDLCLSGGGDCEPLRVASDKTGCVVQRSPGTGTAGADRGRASGLVRGHARGRATRFPEYAASRYRSIDPVRWGRGYRAELTAVNSGHLAARNSDRIIGVGENAPSAAFWVRRLRYAPGERMAETFCRIAATQTDAVSGPMTRKA